VESDRVRCPICNQSTTAPDGYCEFCGNKIAGRGESPEQIARAQRMAKKEPGPAVALPGAKAADYESEDRAADRDAEMAFFTGMLGFFGGNILQFFVGPFAGILGLVLLGVATYKGIMAKRALARLGRTNWMAGCGMWLGIVGIAITLIAIAVITMLIAAIATGAAAGAARP
jgi:hypothetical protein